MHVALVGAEFEENLAVRYLWGALEHAGHEVTQIVFNEAADIERAAHELVASGAEVAGFSMVFTYRAREFAHLAQRARELGYRGHLIAGGHFAAMYAEQLLLDVPAFDSVGCGEGEPILCELTRALPKLESVAGLVWRRGDEVVRNSAAVKPPDLDVLPHPPRKSPFDDYLGIPITNILASRGCTRSCAFCSIAAWHKLCGGPRLRLRHPEHLADEMATLYRQGVRIFNFHDDNFVLDDKAAMLRRAHELGAALAERGVTTGIAFAIKCRPDVVDAQLFSLLKAMGMFRVFLGVEAGTAQSLRQLGRGQTLDDNVRALDILRRLDIHTCFNLLVLNPDSTLEDLAANVAFLRAHPEHAMNFCRTEVYAGTPLERKLRREGRLLGTYWGYDYEIADPRAQAAFDVIYRAFEARNYGDEGLHHLTMQIDYEVQLLQRFFGPHEALRRRVKKLIVEVNHDTCRHLEEVIATVQALGTELDLEAVTAATKERVERDNALLGAKVKALLDAIRTAPERPARKRGRGFLQAAASAGLVATLAAAGCKDKSHSTEMVAVPTAPTAGPPPRDASAEAASVPYGPPAMIKPAVGEKLRELLAEKVVPAETVELELWIDQEGRVGKAMLHRPDLAEAAEKEILDEARKLTFADPNVRGQRFVLLFRQEEFEKASTDAGTLPKPQPTTHPKERVPRPEMAPRPPPPRPEMAPRPIKKGGQTY